MWPRPNNGEKWWRHRCQGRRGCTHTQKGTSESEWKFLLLSSNELKYKGGQAMVRKKIEFYFFWNPRVCVLCPTKKGSTFLFPSHTHNVNDWSDPMKRCGPKESKIGNGCCTHSSRVEGANVNLQLIASILIAIKVWQVFVTELRESERERERERKPIAR